MTHIPVSEPAIAWLLLAVAVVWVIAACAWYIITSPDARRDSPQLSTPPVYPLTPPADVVDPWADHNHPNNRTCPGCR